MHSLTSCCMSSTVLSTFQSSHLLLTATPSWELWLLWMRKLSHSKRLFAQGHTVRKWQSHSAAWGIWPVPWHMLPLLDGSQGHICPGCSGPELLAWDLPREITTWVPVLLSLLLEAYQPQSSWERWGSRHHPSHYTRDQGPGVFL